MKQEKGITLIALAITIIVMLILAGISIRALTNNGILTNSRTASNTQKEKQYEEDLNLKLTEAQIDVEFEQNKTVLQKIKEKIEAETDKYQIKEETESSLTVITKPDGYEYKITDENVEYIKKNESTNTSEENSSQENSNQNSSEESSSNEESEHEHIATYVGTEGVHTKCSICGEILSTTHSYTETVTKAATCAATGTKKKTCACGYSCEETIAKSSTHSISSTSVSYKNTGNSSYHTKYGICTVCGRVDKESEAHSFAQGTGLPSCWCVKCHYVKSS